jgi:hypothetical protein
MKEFFQGLNVVDEEERRAQGRYWLRLAVLVALAATALYVVGLFLPKEARAESSVAAADGSVKYVRHDGQCEDADILKHLAQMGAGERLSEFKRGTLTYGGREWRSCWIEVDEMVYSVDEEGSPLQALPARIFKQAGTGI